jgi:hypothetical protein
MKHFRPLTIALAFAVSIVSLAAQSAAPQGPGPAPSPSGDPRAALADILKAATPLTELGVFVDTSAQPGPPSERDARLQIVSEIRHEGRPLRAVGYAVTDEQSRVVLDAVDSPPQLKYIDDHRVLYTVAANLAPGKYTMKLGALDEDGRRGSVAHGFEVRAFGEGDPRVGDLILGDVTRGIFRPSAHIDAAAGRLGIRLEVTAETREAFQGLTVEVRIAPAGGGDPIGREALTLTSTGERTVRGGSVLFDLSSYAPGEYLVTAIVQGPAGEVARRERTFRK